MAVHEIISMPSASVLAALRKQTSGRSPAPKSLAILADPVFDPADSRVQHKRGGGADKADLPDNTSGSVIARTARESSRELVRAIKDVGLASGGEIPRLPFSRREAAAISSMLPKDQALEALDFNASRDTATRPDLAGYRILHFATHGLLDSENPAFSGMVLSLVNERGVPQDGFLRLHDIFNLNLPAELVVLSACQTALGKEVRGEGLIGLTRGFMYAGAARVVVSLWKVDDVATAELMSRFYRNMLGEGMRPAAALRAAQVGMSRQKRWQDPYNWAAFQIQGEWK